MTRQGHGVKLSFYDWGATPFFALQKDLRVSYCLFVPNSYEEQSDKTYELIVLMHGTERGASIYRDAFADFATEHDCIILAPLFPVGLCGEGELDNYKQIKCGDFRFDLLVLDMVDEVAAKYRLTSDRFMLHGFSGGGHFSHRFFYLHPERLNAVSIGAPGVVTLLNEDRDWWIGTRDLQTQFGKAVRLDLMRDVRVQMVVGSEDTQTWEITIPETSDWWMEGANDAGETRVERLTSLKDSFERSDIEVQFDLVPGVAHSGWGIAAAVQGFFVQSLADMRAQVK